MPTILLVDDSPIDRRIAAELLAVIPDMTLLQAEDGVEAIALLGEFEPHVVITDMQMPRMNGLELTETLVRQRPDLPVVLVTARGSEELAVRALDLGAASYVPKSRLATDLSATVTRILSAAASKHEASRFPDCLEYVECSYRLANDASLLIFAANELTRPLASVWNVCPRDMLRMRLTLEEALLNAMYHGNLELSSRLREADLELYHELANRRSLETPFAERKVHVSARRTSEDVCYIVTDEGHGFDHAKYASQADESSLSESYGRGIVLMKTVMDDVEFNRVGNAVRLTKYRSRLVQPAASPTAITDMDGDLSFVVDA